MPGNSDSVENVVRVPEMMYKSFLTLSNPRKLAIFSLLCRARGKMTTKDIEIELQRSNSDETLSYIADTLRDLENVKLAKYRGDEFRSQSREGDWKQTFKSYEATDHGRYVYNLCRTYDSERPLANLGGALDPKNVVESFTKLKKEELNLLLDKFRDIYLLGGVLVSLYYQKHESANSGWLSNCLGGRLSKNEVEEFLGNYAGSDSLVIVQPVEDSTLDRAILRIGTAIVGRQRMNKWVSKISYSLTPEGKNIARNLATEFYPENLGVDEEYLRPEKLEADNGILGQSIIGKIVFLSLLVGMLIFGWWDLIRRLSFTPSDTTGIVIDLILLLIGFPGSILYGTSRIPGLLVRMAYWRKLRAGKEIDS